MRVSLPSTWLKYHAALKADDLLFHSIAVRATPWRPCRDFAVKSVVGPVALCLSWLVRLLQPLTKI